METNNKYTAGEWKATGLEIRHANNSMILATVYPHLPLNQSREEAEANAKLIAAAPKLLAMCIATLEDIESGEINNPDTLEAAQSNLKEAIKEATK